MDRSPGLIQDQGRFTDYVALDRQAYAVFLRSPHAYADITRIDVSVAAPSYL